MADENENEMAQFPREGEQTFEENTETDDSADSPTGEETDTEKTQSDEGENTQTKEKLPFNEDPEVQDYIARQVNNRAADIEKKYKQDLDTAVADIRKEFGTARQENAENTDIPLWFGGDKSQLSAEQLKGLQIQWKSYLEHEDARLKAAEDRAIESIKKTAEAQESAVKAATDFMYSQLKEIESDKKLNPLGVKFDQATTEKLLKYVMENRFIDVDTNHWDYKKGWKYFQLENKEAGASTRKADDDSREVRKKIAENTNSGNKGETKKQPFKTGADFKKNRPW